jgi:hypothetical protein
VSAIERPEWLARSDEASERYVEGIVRRYDLQALFPGLVWVEASQGSGVDGCFREKTSATGLPCLLVKLEVQIGRGAGGDELLLRDRLNTYSRYGEGDFYIKATREEVASVAVKMKERARKTFEPLVLAFGWPVWIP